MPKELDSQIIVNSRGYPLDIHILVPPTRRCVRDTPCTMMPSFHVLWARFSLMGNGPRPPAAGSLPLSSAYRFCVSFALKTGGQTATQAGSTKAGMHVWHAGRQAGLFLDIRPRHVRHFLPGGTKSVWISDLGWGDYLLRCDDVMSHEINRIHHHINTSTLMHRWFQREASELITNEHAYMHTCYAA
jgi:hypothetical protein